MCNQSVDHYVDALQYVPKSFKAQEMCDKAVDICLSVTQLVPECFKTQEMFDKLLTLVLLYFILFLIDMKLKKCVIRLFLKILLC